MPQGTIIALTLFNIFINGLLELEVGGEIVAQADDTVVIYEDKDIKQLYTKASEGINKIYNWLTQNKLKINIDKTKYIEFSQIKSLEVKKLFAIHLEECNTLTNNQLKQST